MLLHSLFPKVNEKIEEFEKLNAKVFLITSDATDQIKKFCEKQSFKVDLNSDHDKILLGKLGCKNDNDR
jgi:peroxiredoxin